MSKFLFAVCVFGLFLSSAFAEEKSPEQYREERSRIFGIEGLESQTFTRVVASGAKQRIAFYTALNPDCTATGKQFTRVVASGTSQRIGFLYALNPDCTTSGNVSVRVTKQPEHGTVEITTATGFPTYSKENVRYKCNEHKVKGTHVNYKSAEKYVGDDALDLLVLFPAGFAWEVHLDVSVR